MYYGARYYDPWIGRFLSQDPELIGDKRLTAAIPSRPSESEPTLLPLDRGMRSTGGGLTFSMIPFDPQYANAYSYVGNRPTTFTDSDGEVPVPIALAIAGSVAAGGWEFFRQVGENRAKGKDGLDDIDVRQVALRASQGALAGLVVGAPFLNTSITGLQTLLITAVGGGPFSIGGAITGLRSGRAETVDQPDPPAPDPPTPDPPTPDPPAPDPPTPDRPTPRPPFPDDA